MSRRRSGALALLVAGLGACAAPPSLDLPIDPTTRLEQLFEAHFAGYEAPTPAAVREGAVDRLYAGRSFDEVWTSALLLLMQDAVLVRASKESGVIVTANRVPPMPVRSETAPSWYLVAGVPEVLLIEAEAQGTRVYANWLPDWYRLVERPEIRAIGIRPEAKETLARGFHALLGAEVAAGDRLRALR